MDHRGLIVDISGFYKIYTCIYRGLKMSDDDLKEAVLDLYGEPTIYEYNEE